MIKLFLRYLIFIFFISYYGMGKEVFTVNHIEKYLTKDNPYVYNAIGQQYIDEAHIITTQGTFDTILSVEYDNKEYPASTGEFTDMSFSKPIDNGTEFIFGYRKAEGTQEYNNIKTGSNGEVRIGVKVPLFSLLNNINKRKYSLDSAKINAISSTFQAQNNLRNLYSNISNSYYQLLYFNEVLKLEKQLLNKAKKRDGFIKKQVQYGYLSEVSILESKQQIISREQRLLTAKNNYYKTLETCLKYINISKKKFHQKYTLPSINKLKKNNIILKDAINQALKKRPDIKALESKKNQLNLDAKYNALSQYPNLSVFAYGVHDINYGEGFKVGLKLNIPLERRKYKGKKIEIQKELRQNQEAKNRLELELKANLSNLIYSLEIINQNIILGGKEIKIVTELEIIENKKFAIGSSNLFQINQQEIKVLVVKQKQLEYTINALLLQQDLKREMGGFYQIKHKTKRNLKKTKGSFTYNGKLKLQK